MHRTCIEIIGVEKSSTPDFRDMCQEEAQSQSEMRRNRMCAIGMKVPDILQTGHMQRIGDISKMRQS